MLSLAFSALLLLAAPPIPLPQEPPAETETTQVADERPEIKVLFEKLDVHLKAKGEEDDQAIAVLDSLTQEFPKSGPKDRAAIVDKVADCFSVKRIKEIQEGVPDDRLFMAAAVALGTMAPESVKPLSTLINHKDHRKNLRLQSQLALALGKTKSPDSLKTLLSLLKHKDAELQAAGAEALGHFAQAPLETRKDIFEELLKTLMAQKAKKDDVTDLEAQDRWNMISGPIMATMQKLTGVNESNPEVWQSWWNDNKKKDWDAKG